MTQNKAKRLPDLGADFPEIEMIVAEYAMIDGQFSRESRDKGQRKSGPEPHDLLAGANAVATALDTIGRWHRSMMAARKGGDRSQAERLEAIEALHVEVLQRLIESMVPAELRRWTPAEFAAVMPSVGRRLALDFVDRIPLARAHIHANRVRETVKKFDGGQLKATRSTSNRVDRLLGRLADLYREKTGLEAKAGSKAGDRPWPFERFVELVVERFDVQLDDKLSPFEIRAALKRWSDLPR